MVAHSPPLAADPDAVEEVPLREANLSELRDRVDVPGYDRTALRPGVVHIGVGGFHRAHQAVYFDRLADLDGDGGWGVIGVGLHSTEIGEVLHAQDCLYTVVERGAAGSRARVVGALGRYLHAATERGAVLDALTDPETRLVTLTITGGGYRLDAEGAFGVDDPTVAAELEDPGSPDTVFAYLVEALDRRRRAGTAPFTVLSCDNIPSNGRAAATMVTRFAELRDPGLARWISAEVAFPSSMVDRITPATTPEERDEIARTFGVDDRWPVICEPFSQWVVEDRFCNGRPALDRVGVQFVDDVAPYELTKKRLLNASHCALGYLGHLAGHATTADVMADPVLAAFVGGFLDEVVPLLPQVPGLDLDEYRASLLERLANPAIADDLSRLCRRGSVKMPSYLLPSIKEARAAGRAHPLMTLAVAGWFRYLTGVDYAGDPIDVQGPRKEQFTDLARRDGTDPRPLLAEREVFDGLEDDTAFVEELHAALDALRAGPREAVEACLRRDGTS